MFFSVGANGSGKTNFFHAIRFVLSDLFQNLRSEDRHALLHEGAGHQVLSAFVEIVFDNSDNRIPVDKEEVRLRRTIGLKKDEYFLDGKHITKTEVMNLLESAGFSRSNPYYVVQQGKIASLTLMKDSERLDLLKEIGGTRVYEERRRESLKIMQETGNKRKQIIQVVQYLDERLKELDEEKEELRKYQQLDKQRKSLEYTIYDKELHDARHKLGEVEEARTKVSETSTRMYNSVLEAHEKSKDLDKTYKDLTKDVQGLNKEKESIDKQRSEAIQKRTQLELDDKDLREKMSVNIKAKEDAAKQLEILQREIQDSTEELHKITPLYDEKVIEEKEISKGIMEREKQLSILYQKQGRATQFSSKASRDKWLQKEIDDLERVRSSNMVQSVVVERKIFQVKSEDYNGGKWLSITERSQGFVVSLDFGEEETGWLVEQLEKAVELEDSRGYIRKMRGKTRTHMMEICFNSRGCYMKITEYSAKRKPLVLVVPRGVNGCGWENLRKETQNKPQESKGMYRGERTYAEVVAEKGTRNGAGMPVGKWARAVVCEGKGEIRDWCEVGKAIARRVGMKGMVFVTPISAYKGCFFVENARKTQWFQERGSFTVRGEVFALRRWSPEENSVVRGKFRRGWLELRGLPFHLWDEVQLSHVLQQWGRVTKVARNSLKFVDLSKVTLRVEMLPKVVLPALLEVEDGDRTYTVAVTVTGGDDGEDDGGDSIKPESSRSKDELRSAGGCFLQKPQMVEGLRAIDRTSDCQRWMPRHRLHFSSSDSKSAKGEKGKGRWVLGPMAGSNFGPTPDVREARSVWAQVGAKDFGPIAGPAHKGSSNGGPAVSSSSKLQRPGLSAKNKASEGLPQVSSKTKGSPVSVRRRARSGLPRFDEAFSSLKRSFEGGGSLETNRDISRGKSHSRKSDFSTGLETSKVSTGETKGEEGILQCKLINEVRNPFSAVSERDLPLSGAFEPNPIPETSVSLVHPFCVHSSSSYPLESSHAFQRGSVSISPVVYDNHRGGVSCSNGVVVPLETSNQKSKDRPFLRETLSNLEVCVVSQVRLRSQCKNLPLSHWKVFRLRGLRLGRWSRFSRFWSV
uniref:RecF/RecN/SMC N-terminal domain-containing protein n=1 Tax=Vitis vinifera TaxID=29760 RepID=A5ALP1_VITVI|nr:hypothetical protein VITISV_042007 [Vitis vinifera]